MPRRAALLLALSLLLGCQSFARLEADDRAVSEEEVHAAGGADDEGQLTPHLHHIVGHRADYDVEVVVAALVALGERGDPTSVPVVAPLADDPAEEVRFHTAVALGKLGGPQAEETLARLAADDPSPLVRDAASGWGAAE